MHDDFAAGRLDELSALKIMNRFGHAGATNREHQCQKFVRERQSISRHAIVRHQNPACETLRQPGARVGDRRVRRLRHERLNVFQEQAVQRPALIHAPRGRFCRNLSPVSGDLDIGRVRATMIAEDDGDAGHPLASDEADFDVGPILLGDDRSDPGVREDDEFDRPVRVLEAVAQFHGHRDEMRLQQAEVCWRQQLKEAVSVGELRGGDHGSSPVGQEHGTVSQPSAPWRTADGAKAYAHRQGMPRTI